MPQHPQYDFDEYVERLKIRYSRNAEVLDLILLIELLHREIVLLRNTRESNP